MKNKYISIAIVALLIITIEFAFAQNATALEQNFKFEGVWSSKSEYSSDEPFECSFSFENEGYFSKYYIIYYLHHPLGDKDYDGDCGYSWDMKCAIEKGDSVQHQTDYPPPTGGWEPGEYSFCPEVYGPGSVATGECVSFTVKATTSPIINTVYLNTTTPKTGDNILVTVNATDDNKVTSVKAEDISLTNDNGCIWEGTIIALEGTHTVHVLASDEDDNIVWDNSTSYSTITDVKTDVIYVDDDGGKDYSTIQDAVDNASNNDTIIVYSGIYTENVIVNKALKIISESSMPDNTIVQAADPEFDVFYVSADEVTISGFSITGANGNDMVAGICLGEVQHNIISNNKLSNNYEGIYLRESDYNELNDNIANLNNDNGIYLEKSSNNELNNNNASNNDWNGISLGGSGFNILGNNTANLNNKTGLFVGNSSNNKLNNNDLDNNLYGIFLVNSDSNIVNNNNASGNTWEGICLDNSSYNELNHNNASSNMDCGIFFITSSDNTLNNNNASGNTWEGICLDNSSYNELNYNNVSSNTDCGILFITSSYNTLSNNDVLDNHDGIWLESFCNNNQLSNNIIQNSNNGTAIWEDSTNNTLNNNIAANNKVGLTINHSSDNCIYNNYFNNTINVQVENTQSENIWNITKTEGTNIVGGPFIGGNCWEYPDGTGFSQICEDVDKDRICDLPYDIAGDTFDYLPLLKDNTTDIIYVDCNGGKDYTTIQDAVNNANNNNTIIVYSGTYTENVIVDKSLKIISESSMPDNTIIQAANPNYPIFNVSANNVTIDGFSIIEASGDDMGIGIFLWEVQYNEISNNKLTNNNVGIFIGNSSHNRLNKNDVSNSNTSGIFLAFSNNNVIESEIASFSNLSGICLWNSSSNKIYDTIANSNNYIGIIIGNFSNNNELYNNTVMNNAIGLNINQSINNFIYNNNFNNTINTLVKEIQSGNIWNITKTEGTNIVGGPFIGGNCWAYPDGTGFSQICEDVDKDRICDLPYDITGDSFDYLPLLSTQIIDDDSLAPVLSDVIPETGTTDLTPIISINATDSDSGINMTSASMRVNGSLVILTPIQFESTVKFENTSTTTYNHGDIVNVTFSVSDNAGLTSNNTWLFYIDTIIPTTTISSPKEGDSTKESSITVSGNVNGTGSPANVTVNDILATISNGTYSAIVPLSMNSNTIVVHVTDAAGNVNSSLVNVTRTSDSGGSGGSGSSGRSSSASSGTSGEARDNILLSETDRENVFKDSKVSYGYNKEENPIRYINFTGVTSSGQIVVKVEILKSTSSLVDQPAPHITYKNFDIWAGNSGWATSRNIADPTVSFKVEKSWISSNAIDESTITLYRYSGETWNLLSTTKIGEDDEYLYCETKTPGFSPFVITGKGTQTLSEETTRPGEGGMDSESSTEEVEEPDQTSTEETGIPGFGVCASLLILLGAFRLLRKN